MKFLLFALICLSTISCLYHPVDSSAIPEKEVCDVFRKSQISVLPSGSGESGNTNSSDLEHRINLALFDLCGIHLEREDVRNGMKILISESTAPGNLASEISRGTISGFISVITYFTFPTMYKDNRILTIDLSDGGVPNWRFQYTYESDTYFFLSWTILACPEFWRMFGSRDKAYLASDKKALSGFLSALQNN